MLSLRERHSSRPGMVSVRKKLFIVLWVAELYILACPGSIEELGDHRGELLHAVLNVRECACPVGGLLQQCQGCIQQCYCCIVVVP